MRDAKEPTSGAEKEVVLALRGLDRKVGVGGLRTVSVKARDELSELRIANAHAMSWAIADGLPPCSRVPPAKCRPARAQECPQPALRNRGANGKQGRRERVAARNVPQGSPYPGRSPVGPGRRGGLTFELCHWQSRRSPLCSSSIVRKRANFPDGFTLGVLPVCEPRGSRCAAPDASCRRQNPARRRVRMQPNLRPEP